MSDFKPVNQPITPASADPGEDFPFLHTITVIDRAVSVDKPELVQNNIRTETVTLNLDSEWDGLSCIINIGNGDTPTSLIWSGQPVTIPAELMTDIGTLNVSVVGYGDDGALRAVTKKADNMFTVVASGYVEDDEPVPDPTTILGQLVEAADNANQAAQNAEDSTIDKVSVTMLPTGSSASGSVSDKTLSLSIPNGPQGPRGPKGDPGDLTTVAHDDTLTGDGTASNPLGAGIGSALNPYGVSGAVDANAFHDGVMAVTYNTANLPTGLTTGAARGFIIGYHGGLGSPRFTQLLVSCPKGITPRIFARGSEYSTFDEWTEFAAKEDIPDVSALTSRIAALDTKMNELAATQTRLQALEARVKSLETNQ